MKENGEESAPYADERWPSKPEQGCESSPGHVRFVCSTDGLDRGVEEAPGQNRSESSRYPHDGITSLPGAGVDWDAVPSRAHNKHPAISARERFERFVHHEPMSGCWIWGGHLNAYGYGQFGLSDGTILIAHRASYQMNVGPIPSGLHVDHRCRNRACVNPAHLEPVTHAENLRRAYRNGKPIRTHFYCGHAKTAANTTTGKKPRCRQCAQAGARRRRNRECA